MVDSENGSFRYWNCGHPYPYKVSNDFKVEQISARGLFLGTKSRFKAREPYSGTLAAGEKLIFYSDGLVESISDSFAVDGYEMFAAYLQQELVKKPEDPCREILTNHPHFKSGKPQPDDFTVMLIERT